VTVSRMDTVEEDDRYASTESPKGRRVESGKRRSQNEGQVGRSS